MSAPESHAVSTAAARIGLPNMVNRIIAVARVAFTPTRGNVLHWGSWVVALAVFLALAALVAGGRVYAWEIDVTRWVQDVDYPDWLFRLTADRLTNADTIEGAVIISSIVAALWLLYYRLEAVLVLFTVPLHAAANFPKLIIERERPSELIDGITGFGGFNSFPSGHAEYAITLYGFLLYVALYYLRNRLLQGLLVAAWLALVVAVGFARLEVGKHWPLDIIAGYVIGLGLLSGLIWLHRSWKAAA